MPPHKFSTYPKQHTGYTRRGATAVEFSLAAIILFLVVFASIEFARLSILRQVIDNVCYEACRKVIVPGADSAEAVDHVNTVLARYGVTGTSVRISPNPITEATGSVTVQVSAPAGINQWGTTKFSRGLTLRSSTTLLTERPPAIQAKAVPPPPPPPPPPPRPDPPPKPNPPKPPAPPAPKPNPPPPPPPKPNPPPPPKPKPPPPFL